MFKNGRRPYKGESWKIMESVDNGKTWRVHSEYTHLCLRDEAMRKLKKERDNV